ncbi:hypothetical protein V6N11_074228 [Hibiscus sabdariffa]|uniref:RNase H type-1 domain-containing protein n=2 Tax=Hibiscus sabdariffa TaxID=183260 RepID=A0ABR2AW81_9ROSI
MICAIPLSKTGLRDELGWRFDGSGSYSVKSGYRLLQTESCVNAGGAADMSPGLSQFFSESIANSWKEWLSPTFLCLSFKHKKALIVTFSAVWYACNKLVHEGLKPVFSNTLSFIVASLKETELLLDHASRSPPLPQAKWIAPPENVVKVKFDSAFSLQTRQSVSGVICRDIEGMVLVACSFLHALVRDAFMVEALLFFQALVFAQELGFTRVLFEGDSRTII